MKHALFTCFARSVTDLARRVESPSEGQNFYLSYYNKIYIVHNIMVKQPTLSSYFYFEFEAIFVAKRLF